MTLQEIIADIESVYPNKVQYAITVGGASVGSLSDNSDLDYAIFTNDTGGERHYDNPNTDVWLCNLYAAKQVYPFFQICNFDGIDHLVYCINDEVERYFIDNKDALTYEFSTVVFNILSEYVKELNALGENAYELNIRANGSRMRDAVLSTYMLTNYMLNRPISELTAEQKQILRDIRGKDGKRYTYQECLDILNSNYTDELVAHYSSYYPGKKHTRELFKILNRVATN